MFWNEFDALDVAIRASNASAVPSDVEGVLAEAGGLAAWVEARKFGASIEGGACGSALLREVAAAAVDVGGPDLHVFSAHYPTMLCALTAVGVSVSSGESADSWLGEALLPTGSALAFEVVPPEAAGAAAASAAVRLLYWDGSEWRLIPVPCSRSEARLASCPLDAFVRHVEVSLPDGAAWCRACDNDSLARFGPQRAHTQPRFVGSADPSFRPPQVSPGCFRGDDHPGVRRRRGGVGGGGRHLPPQHPALWRLPGDRLANTLCKGAAAGSRGGLAHDLPGLRPPGGIG